MHRLESACFLFAVCPKQWENASIVLPLALYLIGEWNGSNHPCRKPCTLILVYTINVIWSHFWAFFNRLFCRAKVDGDFPERHHLREVSADVLDVRLDRGLQPKLSRGLHGEPWPENVCGIRVHLLDHLFDQRLSAFEAIDDDALADACSFGDLSQRGLGIAQRGNRLDGARNELCSSGCLNEGGVFLSIRYIFRPHGRMITQVAGKRHLFSWREQRSFSGSQRTGYLDHPFRKQEVL